MLWRYVLREPFPFFLNKMCVLSADGYCRPTLLGQQTGAQMADGGLQQRVVETILASATAIFDED